MRKKLLVGLLSGLMCLSVIGCSEETVDVNTLSDENLSGSTFGIDNLINIGGHLYYERATRIVYFWNSEIHGYSATTPSPYYTPNGLPYRYNPGTNTFEEINSEVSK